MIDTNKVAIRATTQEHLEIEDVQDDIVILKDGGACVILNVSSINFDLLSEKEQKATIYAYASLLNSLTFSIQLVIRSQRKDVSAYLKLLKDTAKKTSRSLIKKQIQKYRRFIEQTVQKNNVLDKKFYLVIPMSPLEIGATKALFGTLSQGANQSKRKLPFPKDYIIKQAKIKIYPKKDHLIRQLNRLGIRGRQLTNSEIIKLFFDIYNPGSQGQQISEAKQYQTPLAQSQLPDKDKPQSSPPPTSAVPTETTVFNQINNLVKNA